MADKSLIGERRRLRVRSGLTLVELMIVVLISTVVGGVALSLFQANSRHYVRQDAIMEQSQNLRTAMYTIGREVRMAGNGFGVIGQGVDTIQAYVPQIVFTSDDSWEQTKGWFEYIDNDSVKGIMRICAIDGGVSNSDRLTIFRSDPELGLEIGALSEPFTANGGSNFLSLQEELRESSAQAGDILVLVNGVNDSEAIFLEMAEETGSDKTKVVIGPKYNVRDEQSRDARFYPEDSNPQLQSFPAGSRLYNVREMNLITFFVDAENSRLMADYFDSRVDHYDADGAVIVATDIEDFQVRFQFADNPGVWRDTGLNTTNFSADRVIAAEIGLVSRSALKDPSGGSKPIKLFNHVPDGQADGHPRRVLTEVIALRNN